MCDSRSLLLFDLWTGLTQLWPLYTIIQIKIQSFKQIHHTYNVNCFSVPEKLRVQSLFMPYDLESDHIIAIVAHGGIAISIGLSKEKICD